MWSSRDRGEKMDVRGSREGGLSGCLIRTHGTLIFGGPCVGTSEAKAIERRSDYIS